MAALDGGDAPRPDRRRARHGRPRRPRAPQGRRLLAGHARSGSGSLGAAARAAPARARSRRPASTRRACATCRADPPARRRRHDRAALEPPVAEVEELCDRVAIVRPAPSSTKAGWTSSRRVRRGYRLRTTDDALAARVCRAQPGVSDVASGPDGIALRAERGGRRAAVGRARRGRIGILALVPRTATLEDLFFDLTEGAPSAPPHVTTVEEHA